MAVNSLERHGQESSGEVFTGEFWDRVSQKWLPQSLVDIRADWIVHTQSGPRPSYEHIEISGQVSGPKPDVRAGVIAVTAEDVVIACASLVLVAKSGRRTLVAGMPHADSGQPSLISSPYGTESHLRTVN